MTQLIYENIDMMNHNIKSIDELHFETNDYNYIDDDANNLYITGANGMSLSLNNSSGGIWVQDCITFRPNHNSAGQDIDLGSLGWAEWKNLYLKSGGNIYVGGVPFTSLGIHDHSTSVLGGTALAPITVKIVTGSSARLRIPVGTNLYG